jgi:arylsulfatase
VVDIAPTLLEMMGLKSPASFRGKSLMPLIATGGAVNDYVFAGAAFTPSEKNPFFRYNSTIVSARSQKWKLIAERVSLVPGPQDSFELYDLAKDPEELRNVAAQNPEALKELKTAINNWSQEIKAERFVPQL